MKRSPLAWAVMAVLALAQAACAQLPAATPPEVPATTAAPAEAAEPATPSTLDAELFYQLLLGEIDARGAEPAAGYSLILDAARKTNDPVLYQRAVDVAFQARSADAALQAARAWKQAYPDSPEANRHVLQILVALNRVPESMEPLKAAIALTDAKDRNAVLSLIPRTYARVTNKKQAATLVEQALGDYLSHPANGAAAWTAVGHLRLAAGDSAGALDAARRGQALNPRSEGPVLLALELMDPKLPQAEPIVRHYLGAGKPLPELRMGYARALLDAQRYSEAAQQLKVVTAERPDYPEAWLVQGTLQLQDNQDAAAEASLKRYIALAQEERSGDERSRGLAQAYLSLSRVAEKRKDYALAGAWLDRIENPQDLVAAQLRRASILARQGKLDEARKLLHTLPDRTPEEARTKLMAEVQLLRDNKQYQAAYDLLAQAGTKAPLDADQLYDQAMLAEKLDNLPEMERLLRQVMKAKPDYHHAYNALGYSLAEHNIRLPEAKELIQKALTFAPEDPFISDSLAWVEYRMGNKTEALRILDGAYKTRPDADIAAHLGEVLWSLGQRDRAQAIWKEGLLLNSDNDTLLETLKRLAHRAMIVLAGRRARCWLVLVLALLSGCATPPKPADPLDALSGPWAGRLALQVQDQPGQSFSAGFELRGNAQAGELSLFSPLGGTLAVLTWQPQSATLRSNDQERQFGSVDALVAHATGSVIPVGALFDWLRGIDTPVTGWRADLTQIGQGRLLARRVDPPPQADLRVVLEH